jgi:hypothetical protein
VSLSRHQLQRAELITQIEQGRRVEQEQFQENHRGLQTMGELLKARVFGATEWAISLRKRMMNVGAGLGERGGSRVESAISQRHSPDGDSSGVGIPGPAPTTLEPHKFPCEDPYCDPCAEAIKRIFRDLNLLPKGNPDRASYTADPVTGRLKVAPRYRKDDLE